jgi:hypothetical protein
MSFRGMFKAGDIAVVAAAGLVAFLWSSSSGRGRAAEYLRLVTDHGEDTLHLGRDTTIHTDHLTVEIQGGRAAITVSDCPNQYCTAAGWIERPGQTAACMPNRTLIEILEEDPDQLDAVSY